MLTEAAVRRQLCEPQVMAVQIGPLMSLSELPNIRLGIIPLNTCVPDGPLNTFTGLRRADRHSRDLALPGSQVSADGSCVGWIGALAAVDEADHADQGGGAAEAAGPGDEGVDLGVESLGAADGRAGVPRVTSMAALYRDSAAVSLANSGIWQCWAQAMTPRSSFLRVAASSPRPAAGGRGTR